MHTIHLPTSPPPQTTDLATLATLANIAARLRKAKNVIVVTGAGISTEAGIPVRFLTFDVNYENRRAREGEVKVGGVGHLDSTVEMRKGRRCASPSGTTADWTLTNTKQVGQAQSDDGPIIRKTTTTSSLMPL